MNPLPIRIIGVGRYLPQRIVTAHEIERMCNLPDGWVLRHAGVAQRHWANEEETNSFMGAQAACEALVNAGLKAEQIDLLINASGSYEQAIPDTAPLIQRQMGLGASGIPCMTVHATCLSFLVALDTAASLITSGRYRTILIVTSEIASVGVNSAEAESATLLGDAAAAVVVTAPAVGESSAILAARIETYGDGAHLTQVPGGGARNHPNKPHTRPSDNLFHMDGPAVARVGLRYSEPFLERVRPGLSRGLGTIRLVVPHQASLLMIRSLTRYGWAKEQIAVTLDRLGNCIAASLPCTLYEVIQAGRIQRGDELLLVGTGAGLSLGAVIVRY